MKHVKLNILALFMHHFCIRLQLNPYSEPTSYYENRSLCTPGKIDVRHFGLTYFRLMSDVTLFPLNDRHNFNVGLTTFNFHNIQNWGKTVSMCKSKVSICTVPDSLSLKVVWGMLYSFAAFLTGILLSPH